MKFFDNPTPIVAALDCAKWPGAGSDGPIAHEPTVWHDNATTRKDDQLVDKKTGIVDQCHGHDEGWVSYLMPVFCVPVLINGLASIFRIEMEVRTNMRIGHLL